MQFKFDARGFSLEASLFCGQTFSWQKNQDESFTGVAGARAAKVWQKKDFVFAQPIGKTAKDDEMFWKHYFALDEDYEKWQLAFKKDAKLKQCVESCPGIRVLNQPFFDTLLSFIISQNNNIPRISGIVGRLRQAFGPLIVPGLQGFPLAKTLAGLSVEDLAPLRAGFRAKYLLDAANCVAQGKICEEELRLLPTDEARKALCQIYGVGQKVADCVLLFSLERKDVVPMDVWMKRTLALHFNGEMPICALGGQGIAQQFVFHWARGQEG